VTATGRAEVDENGHPMLCAERARRRRRCCDGRAGGAAGGLRVLRGDGGENAARALWSVTSGRSRAWLRASQRSRRAFAAAST
jgi:hypothetical protein